MPTATSVLRASLDKHNVTFETLLSLIPAKFYLARDDNNDQVGPIVSLSWHTDGSDRVHLGTTRIKKFSRHRNRRSKRPPRKRVVKRYSVHIRSRLTVDH